MEVPETPEGVVDVAAVMEQVRDQVRRERERGVLTREDVERAQLERRRRFGERARIDPKLIAALLHPSHDWNTRVDYLVRTRRPGLQGRLIVLAKKLVRPFVRLYTDHILDRQAQINLYFAYFLEDTVGEVLRLEAEVKRLQHRLRQLEADKGP